MPLTANELRRLVEGADGTRDVELTYAVENDGLRRLKPDRTEPEVGKFIKVSTPFNGKGLRGTKQLTLTNGNIPKNIPPGADAAFTTQSAFEKFVLPYYVRTRTIKELNNMAERFYKDGVICAYHDPSSEIDTIADGDIILLHADGRTESLSQAQPEPEQPSQ